MGYKHDGMLYTIITQCNCWEKNGYIIQIITRTCLLGTCVKIMNHSRHRFRNFLAFLEVISHLYFHLKRNQSQPIGLEWASIKDTQM